MYFIFFLPIVYCCSAEFSIYGLLYINGLANLWTKNEWDFFFESNKKYWKMISIHKNFLIWKRKGFIKSTKHISLFYNMKSIVCVCVSRSIKLLLWTKALTWKLFYLLFFFSINLWDVPLLCNICIMLDSNIMYAFPLHFIAKGFLY